MILKYVMIDNVHPVLFFTGMQHDSMRKLGHVTSAGFVALEVGKEPQVMGESESLNMKPGEIDAKMISRMLVLMEGTRP